MQKTTPVEPGTVWLLRVDLGTVVRHKRRWIVYDRHNVIQGRIDETRKSVVGRWQAQYGPVSRQIRYKGQCTPAEAAATMATDRTRDQPETAHDPDPRPRPA